MGGNMMSVVIENDFQNDGQRRGEGSCQSRRSDGGGNGRDREECRYRGYGRRDLPHPCEDLRRHRQGGAPCIINGAECEPYITGDHRTMLERPEEIIGGATYLAKMFGVDKVIIGVEDNKQNGIDAMNKVIAEKKAPVVVEPLRCRYPQGGEKQLMPGHHRPAGASRRPARRHRLRGVQHQHHHAAIFRAITTGMPVVKKIVTVSGSGVVEPKNIECPIGTPVSLPVRRLRRT